MNIRSRTKVVPKEYGSRRVLTRFRYVSATRSAETLDREVSITEQIKCLNSHVGPPVPRELLSAEGATTDEIKYARFAMRKQEVSGDEMDQERWYLHAREARTRPLGTCR